MAAPPCQVQRMTITKAGLIAAPVCFFGYGVLRLIGKMDGRYGPGPDWQAAHIVFLVGLALFVPAVLALGRALPDTRLRRITVVGTLVGVAASMIQIGIDIVAGLLAADHDAMNSITDRVGDLPGAQLAIYQVGPQLLYVGLVVLSVLLARARVVSWWHPALVLLGVVLPAVSLNLLPIGAVCLLVALAPTASRSDDRSNAESELASAG
jgi:hypothetical protein